MKQLYLLVISFLFTTVLFASYRTPNTGKRWNMDSLVAASNGVVTLVQPGIYQVNDTVFVYPNDTLYITSNATVRLAAGTYFDINGIITINPPTGATFTAVNSTTGYLGMRIDSSNGSSLRKLTMEYAVSLRLTDCSPAIDSCVFRYNNNSTSTSFGTSAILLSRSNSLITNSQFIANQRAAISGGANIANAPRIYNCLFSGNNTQNANVPQINLGTSGTDTVRILNNQILRASTNSGGIGFLPIGDVRAIITGNIIKNNRYGLTFNGGANINALVSYNQIDSNNIQNDPNLGGSGIAFSGGSATSHQNVIVTGNFIRYNLWGITIGATATGGGAKPNLGNITNTDTTDDGKNQIYGNNNASTPNNDLYNNNVDSIYAQNNYWGSSEVAVVESHIFHKPDNAALGFVNYLPLYTPLPVKLLSFSAIQSGQSVVLNWQTASERNSHYFEIERSHDGRIFYSIGKVSAAGNTATTQQYSLTDASVLLANRITYYRLKQVDRDGAFTYSKILTIANQKETLQAAVFPNPIKDIFTLSVSQNSSIQSDLSIVNMNGQVIYQRNNLPGGTGVFTIDALEHQPAGTYILQLRTDEKTKELKLIKE